MKRLALLLIACLSLAAFDWQGLQYSFENQMSGGDAGGGVSLPQSSSIVFQWDAYDESTTPQVGSITYTRSGTINYYDSATTLTSAGANVIPIGAMRAGQSVTGSGVLFEGAIQNYCLQSEDFGTTWTTVGGGSVTANQAEAPDGTTTMDLISGSTAGDGVEQSIADTAASDIWLFSVWLKTSSGTQNVDIKVSDNTGSEIGIITAKATTSAFRFEVTKSFSAAASGNVKVQILPGNGAVLAWGAQAEKVNTGTGRRSRQRGASSYIKTTTAAVSSGNAYGTIPNAIAAQLATRGSFAAWVNAGHDHSDANSSALHTIFCVATNERLAFGMAGGDSYGLILKVNGSIVSNTYMGHAQYADTWTHLATTWDTDTDDYRIYINGVDVTQLNGTAAAAGISTTDLVLGNWGTTGISYLAADAILAQSIFWSTALTGSEVAEVYADQSAIFNELDDVGTGKLFEVALGTSLTPTTAANNQYWYVQNSPVSYYDSATTIAIAAQGETTVGAHALNNSAASGMILAPIMTNYLLQSEDLTTTWTKIDGGETVATDVTTGPDGNTSANIIVGDAAGEGVQQSVTGATAASLGYSFSIYVARASGAGEPQIRIEDSTNSEGTTLTISPSVANGVWDRYHVSHTFSSGATGDVNVKILVNDSVGDTSGYYFWGAMLRRVGGSVTLFANSTGVYPYVPTTTTTAASGFSELVYPSKGNFRTDKGTIIGWAFLDIDLADFAGQTGPTLFGAAGHGFDFYATYGGTAGDMIFRYEDTAVAQGVASVTRNQWSHFAYTWDRSAETFAVYKDGVLIDSGTGTYDAVARKRIHIGMDGGTGFDRYPNDLWIGGIDKVTVYGEAKDTDFVLADFNATKSGYGR